MPEQRPPRFWDFWWAIVVAGARSKFGLTVIVLMAILPAVLASTGNAVLRRDSGAVARAGVLAAAVCYLGFLLFVLMFLLTVPPEFFQ